MKFVKKTLAVAVSLALCGSMIAPAFAAVELSTALDENGGWIAEKREAAKNADTGVEEYYLDQDLTLKNTLAIGESEKVSIDLQGNDLSVEMAKNGYNTVVKVEGDLTVNDTSEAGDGAITGGKGLQAGGGVHVDGGSFTLEGGTISGNSAYRGGGGVQVANGGSFEMKGGTISGNKTITMNEEGAGGVYVTGKDSSFTMSGEDSLISQNTSLQFGGGVNVDKGGSFEMKGGAIDNNTAAKNGGGVAVANGQFTMNDGEITNNNGGDTGGGVYVNTTIAKQAGDKAQFIMNDGEISGNTAKAGGGVGSYAKGANSNKNGYVAVDINGGKITSNTATSTYGGGVHVNFDRAEISNAEISGNHADSDIGEGGGIYANQSNISIENTVITGNTADGTKGQGGGISVRGLSEVSVDGDSKIYNNTAKNRGDDIAKQGASIVLSAAESMNVTGKDGKPITGWYLDKDGQRWGVNEAYTTQDTASTADFFLKAAHNQYFGVSYYLDEDAAELYAAFEAKDGVEKGFIPVETVAPAENPTREGFNFLGWVAVDGIGEDGKVTGEVKFVAQWEAVPVPPTTPDGPDIPDDGGDTEIDDQAVPLAAGPVTRAEFIDYLWRHEGEPASDGVCTFTDVPEDHQFVQALAWAEQNGVAEAYEDGTFDPDELVSVGDVREFLGNFASAFGGNAVDVSGLTTLTGEDDEAVLNCDQVIAEFFGEEYTPAQSKDEELDTAA